MTRDVIHVDGKVDPASDMETINTELILADLQTLENAIPRLEKAVKIKKATPPSWQPTSRRSRFLRTGTRFSHVRLPRSLRWHI